MIQPIIVGLNKNDYATSPWIVDGHWDYLGNRAEGGACS